jgi:CRP/FNR family transcriptional regulator, cyclic AMP receptor protein
MSESTTGTDPLDAAMPELRSAGHVTWLQAVAGQTIFTEGDDGDRLYLIERGRVRVGRHDEPDRDCLFSVLGPGDVFGEESVFDPGPCSCRAVALTDVVVLCIERAALVPLLASHPEMAQRLLRVMARRIRATSNAISDTLYADVGARVAKRLLGLAQQFGVQEHGATRVPMDLTQEQFAHLVGTSRESVNKALCEFASRGWITVAKHSIVIRASDALRARVHGTRRPSRAAAEPELAG